MLPSQTYQEGSPRQGALRFLVRAEGAFFALADAAALPASGAPRLVFEDAGGAECGAVTGMPSQDGAVVVFCGDGALLARARRYRIDNHPAVSLRPLISLGIAPDKAWQLPSHPVQRAWHLWWQRAKSYLARALYLIRTAQFRELGEALWSKLARRPRPGRTPPPAPELPVDSFQAWLQERLDAAPRLVLVVDHGLGGGATHYAKQRIERFVRDGNTVLFLTSEPSSGTYILHVHDENGVESQRSMTLSAFGRVDGWAKLGHILYNTGALFVSPLDVLALMLRLRQASGARLEVLFHDYFAVCPSIFLISTTGRYCGLPDAASCRRCLPNNYSMPDLLGHYRHYDPVHWRQAWECLLRLADETTAFSRASADIAARAWPWLDASRLQVVPHRSEPLAAGPVQPGQTEVLHLGIVGQIGYHKGIEVIGELVRCIRQRGLDVRISVIGAVEAPMDSRIVSQTGPYKRDDLPRLIAESGANIMLFPSVWPETFSYVVQELMALQLPVACFGMGAPAERVRPYEKGLILEDGDGAALLDQLQAFFERLYRRN